MAYLLCKNEKFLDVASKQMVDYEKRLKEEFRLKSHDIVFVKDEPSVYTIMNEAVNPEKSGFEGMITLTNLCEDALDKIILHIPKKWSVGKKFSKLNKNGEWEPIEYDMDSQNLVLKEELRYLEPLYILVN